ncbi:MAG: tetratricopeptide (TPR) repeat protein [Cocleimonas sp.]|jgi:tetratricopeptide (TPR) repeat protein
MFKKRIKETQDVTRVDPEIDSNQTFNQHEIKVKVHAPRKLKQKKGSNWFNWFVPLLLISIGVGFLVLYPAPDPQLIDLPKINNVNSTKPVEIVFNANSLSNELVSRYFNGTNEDKNAQKVALKRTLDTLSVSSNPQAKKALLELQSSNINAAKKSLVNLASQQSDLQKSSQTWINIGNIQNLSSSRQALQAYKKASDIDPENITAYSRQGDVYRQLKQLDLAEKAYKRVQSFANQSTANQALTLSNFGLLNVSKGKLVEAEDAFNEALSIYKKIEDSNGVADISFNLANLYKGSERFVRAESHYKTALKNFTERNDFKKVANTHAALGELFQTMQLYIKAQNQYEIALEVNTNNNFEESKPAIYQSLGEVAEENGDTERAKNYFAKAKGIDPDATQDNSVADELGRQAIANRKQRDFLKAEEQHKQAIRIYQNNNSIAGTISQQINLGFLYKVWDKQDLSCLVWRDTLMISERANSPRTSRVQQLVDTSCL